MKKLITVILVTFNDGSLYDCLESLMKQSFSEFKIILINDGGKDFKLPKRFKTLDIEYIKLKKNIGLTKCLNIAIKKTSSKYIARIDSDDYALPERLEMQLSYIIEKNFDLIGSSIIQKVSDKETKLNIIHKESNIEKIIKFKSPLAHPTFFGKTSLFKDILYNENLYYSQDYDFIVRAFLKKYSIGNLNIPLLIYENQPRKNFKKIITQMQISNLISKNYINYKKRNIPYPVIKYPCINPTKYEIFCLNLRYLILGIRNKQIKKLFFLIYLIISLRSDIQRKFNLRNISLQFHLLLSLN